MRATTEGYGEMPLIIIFCFAMVVSLVLAMLPLAITLIGLAVRLAWAAIKGVFSLFLLAFILVVKLIGLLISFVGWIRDRASSRGHEMVVDPEKQRALLEWCRRQKAASQITPWDDADANYRFRLKH